MSTSDSTRFRFCGACGRPLAEGVRFCGSCGEQVPGGEQRSGAPTTTAPASMPPASAPAGALALTDRFCAACGHQLHADERFCGACGRASDAPAQPAVPTAARPVATVSPGPAPRASSGRGLWWVAIALLLAFVAVLAVALVIWLGRGDDPAPTVLPSVTATPAPTTTAPPTTAPTTAAPTTAPTTEAPPLVVPIPEPTTTGFFVPEEAVADWAWTTGLNYQGECSTLSSTADYGFDPWCATLWEDRGGVLIYRVADFPGGDFAFWVLVGTGADGWIVNEVSDDLTGAPPF